jgi:signal transduction histidine kinase
MAGAWLEFIPKIRSADSGSAREGVNDIVGIQSTVPALEQVPNPGFALAQLAPDVHAGQARLLMARPMGGAPTHHAEQSNGQKHPLSEMREKFAFARPTGDAKFRPSRSTFENVWGRGAARQVVSHFTQFHSKELAQLEVMREERRRFARDIHDGILQVLTGAAMQLEAASQLIDSDPATARACVRTVCDLIAGEQRELRALIRKAEPMADASSVSISELAAVLEKIRERSARQWALRIELTITGHGHIPHVISDDVYNLVQEALANVARHAKATEARVSLMVGRSKVTVTVSDDGCGFPLHGRFDLPALIARDAGPVSLRERLAERHGWMVLISSLSGSSLEMSLPLNHDPNL